MKRIILICIVFMLSLAGIGQNGGQFNENNLVTVKLTSHNATQLNFTLASKQTCPAKYRISYQAQDYVISLSANGDTVITVPIGGATFKVKASGATCVSQPDMGWVEVNILQALPVKFVSFKTIPLENDEVEVTFEIAEAVNVKQFNIRMSTDSKSWKVVAVEFPDKLQPNRIYSTKIKL